MEKHWFDSTPPRSRRTVFTIVGSVLLHGALIVAAALYPVRYAKPVPEPPTTQLGVFDPPPGDPEPPIAEVKPAPPPEAPEPPPTDVSTDTPPSDDPEIVDPAPPKPHAPKTIESKLRTPRSTTPASPRGGQIISGARSAVNSPGMGRPGATGRWNTPQPPYPYVVRAAHVQGSGSVRITTDGSGRVVSASVAQSTGNALLDDNTCRFARTNWSGPPNASVTVPITYQMR